MRFSVIYQPTNLFSLKDSNSTNSGAKSLLIPSPYAIKMALFNQAISSESDEVFNTKKSRQLKWIRDAKIYFHLDGSFCVNNCFVTIQSLRDKMYRGKPSFREYIFISEKIEIIFEVDDNEQKSYLYKYLHRINYFGKKGCFFQFVGYSDNPSEPNVKEFDTSDYAPGILQELDDLSPKAEFKHINNYDRSPAKRVKKIYMIPVQNVNSSKSYTHYKVY